MFTLAILGRPNVGKSTLFNRMAGKQLAIVDDRPGVTRDWREADGYLLDQPIRIIDTAGLEEKFDESIEARMRRQTEQAIDRADAVLFVVDGRAGITPLDKHFADWLRRQKKPVILGVNKCEHDRIAAAGLAEAYGLGLGDPIPLSAAHGHGFDDLYHAFLPYFPPEEMVNDEEQGGREALNIDALEGNSIDEDLDRLAAAETDAAKPIKIAIVGRPNVGKSTLLNALLQDERVMTGPEAGLTRDAIAVDWEYQGRKFKLVDTAGMRKRARVQDKIEKMAVDDSLRAIRLAQIVVLVVDAGQALEKQDLQIADHIIDEGRALVIAVNKWDAVEDKNDMIDGFRYKLDQSLAQIKQLPHVPVSALHGRNLDRLLDTVMQTYETWNRRVSTGKLNRWLAGVESQHPAPLVSGRANRLRYMTQIKIRPPTFVIWVSKPIDLPDTYKRYLVNRLREDFDLPGVPIRLMVRTSKNPYAES